MSGPIPVTVVRPRLSARDAVVALVNRAGNVALSAWIVMLIAGTFGWSGIGYWDAALVVIGVRVVLGDHDEYRLWTQEAKR